MEEVKDCTFVLPGSVRDTWPVQQFLRLAEKAGIFPEISLVPDVSAMEYVLKNSRYLTFASQATTLFFDFPDRFAVLMDGPEYAISYYLVYPKEAKEKIKPLRDWILSETGKL